MSKRAGWILFALSAIFNVFFLGGFVQARRQLALASSPTGRAELIADRLKLDGNQRASFAELTKEFISRLEQFKTIHGAEADSFWQVVQTDPEDTAKIQTKLDANVSIHRNAEALRFQYLLDVLKILNPEQRAGLIRIVKQRDIFAQ
jgi:Spy/CpxP family protein refolding chaperone